MSFQLNKIAFQEPAGAFVCLSLYFYKLSFLFVCLKDFRFPDMKGIFGSGFWYAWRQLSNLCVYTPVLCS